MDKEKMYKGLYELKADKFKALQAKYDKLHDLNQKASDGIYNTNVALRELQVKYEALERKLDQEQDRFNSLVKSLEGLWEDDESYRFDYVNDAVTSFRSDLKAILTDHKQYQPLPPSGGTTLNEGYTPTDGTVPINQHNPNETNYIWCVDKDSGKCDCVGHCKLDHPKESECDECGGDKYVDMGDCPDGLAYVIDCPKCTNK